LPHNAPEAICSDETNDNTKTTASLFKCADLHVQRPVSLPGRYLGIYPG
jgi:hypothetical protein